MKRKFHVRFGGGPSEKCPTGQLAGGLPYNVYHDFGGVLEGVCWPAKQTITLSPAEIPEKMVRQFVSLPNNAARYARDLLSHNAPATGYRAFLKLIEKRGAVEHDWLEPCAMTMRDLHDQRRRKS